MCFKIKRRELEEEKKKRLLIRRRKLKKEKYKNIIRILEQRRPTDALIETQHPEGSAMSCRNQIQMLREIIL